MRILGHRGASCDRPENTIAAFVEAEAQGAEGVELDVMRCATGELVVCHDEWLDRLAGLHWNVWATPWHRLAQVDVGSTLGFAPARLPLLDDVFDALSTSAIINVELKCDTVDDYGLSLAVAGRIVERGLEDRVFLSSFNPWCLMRVASVFPALRRGFLLDPERRWFPQAWLLLPLTASTSVHPHASQVTTTRANQWHERGWEIVAWTVDEADEARRLRAMGVEYLITNRPGALRAALSDLPLGS
jgi:glycerophosphoryl diester phosphodiesterase